MKAKYGISLIVLVITIVVIIILAAAVILSLGSNNPINSSRVAKLTQSKDNIESAMSIYISSKFVNTAVAGETNSEAIITSADGENSVCHGSTGKELTLGDGTKVSRAFAITKWTTLEITEPAGETWYYAPNTGKVYVMFAAKGATTAVEPSWANDTTNAFTVTAVADATTI